LLNAGARVTLFCYGHGAGPPPPDLELVRTPRWLAPVPLAAGPHPGKPLADAVLLAALLAAQSRRRFDAALAHNGEAAALALMARVSTGTPVVYVAHTLLRHELPSYGPRRFAACLAGTGEALDAELARRADAVIALSHHSERTLRIPARGPVVRIPPSLPRRVAPSDAEVEAACRRHRLPRGGFVLYTGNLDPYQDLDELAAAARNVPAPVVAATHAHSAAAPEPLRTLRIRHVDEGRRLCFGAGVLVLPRRRPGGFPMKLLNYMEAGRPIVAHRGIADGLQPGRSVWLLEPGATAADLATALRRLLDDVELAARLGREARRQLERCPAGAESAARTLSLVRRVCHARRGRRP
jgi:glycosyltransferase involved in cell wall biosynthesis